MPLTATMDPSLSGNPFTETGVVEPNAIQTLSKFLMTLSNVENTSADVSEDYGDSSEYQVLDSDQIVEATADNADQASVKSFIRCYSLSVLNAERRLLWKSTLTRMTEARGFPDTLMATKDVYLDTLNSCFGTTSPENDPDNVPGFIDRNHRISHYLTSLGRGSVARILICLNHNAPQIQHCPELYSVTALLRHFMSEVDTYATITNLMSSKVVTYLPLTKLQHEVYNKCALDLTKKVSGKYVDFLLSESSREELEGLFQQWQWWILDWLPFPHLVRIFDSFLVEGDKVFFRVSFALISIFTKKVQAKQSGWNGSIKKRGLQGAFIHFCRNIPVSPSSLLDKCFRYRNFSRSALEKAKMKIELDIKSKGLIPNSSNSSPNRSQSADRLNDVSNVESIRGASTNLTYKQLTTIWQWIPERMCMFKPELAYSSDNDGLSLFTFYRKVEVFEPTVLVIRTTNKEIFGAYCSTSWAERSAKNEKGVRNVYFGSGETFLFSFAVNPNGKKYSWILAPGSNVDTSQLSKAELHARQLFMSGQHDMISIGGGDGNGIYIDSTLTRGKTDTCQTFGNLPLCNGKDFEVASIEVFGIKRLDY